MSDENEDTGPETGPETGTEQAAATDAGTGADPGAPGDAGAQGKDDASSPYAWMGENLSPEDQKYLEAKKFDNPRKVYDSLRAAEDALHKGDKVDLPKDDPLNWDGWKKLGAPEDGAAYEFAAIDVPEGLENLYGPQPDLEQAMRGAFASAKLLPAQASAVYDSFNAFQRAQAEETATLMKKDTEATDSWMAENWGSAKQERLGAAIEAARKFGIATEGEGSDILDRMAMVGGSAPMLAVFDALAQATAGDAPKGGAFGGTGGSGGGDAAGELASFEAQHAASLTNQSVNPEGMTRKQLVDKWKTLRDAAASEREAAKPKKQS